MMCFDVLQPADVAEMVSVLGETFAHRDPPAVAVELAPSEFEFFVKQYGPTAIDERLTIVARAGSGELAGALLAEDSATAAPESLNQISPKFDPIFDILGQLDGEYRSTRNIQAGEAIHLFLLGVSPRFAGRGVAQGLVSACLTNSMTRGYRLAMTEATNRTSQHVFRKLGFVERVRRPYADHRFNGRACFDAIADQGGPILLDRELAR
jgi:ribosomal protein S18 acetylase RimI-like enzyme